MGLIGVGNTPGTWNDVVNTDDGIQCCLYSISSDGYFYVKSGNDSSVGGAVTKGLPLKNGQIKRRGSTATATLYNDSGRTEIHREVSTSCMTTLFRYVFILQNWDDDTGTDRGWYVQNVEIIDTDYSSSSSSSESSSSSSSSESQSSSSSSSESIP
jgi:hypothetical protein